MAQKPLKTSRPISSLLLGLAGALVVVIAHLAGLDRDVELDALDLRLRHLAGSEPPGAIVHIDIDDRSLAELGRWPWPRQRLAGILHVLGECGARTIALDIILPEPQKVRYVSAAGEIYGAGRAAVLGRDEPVPVLDDAILADAIRRGPHVAMPMYVDFAQEPKLPLQEQIEAILAAQPLLRVDQLAERVKRPPEEIERLVQPGLRAGIDARVEEILSAAPQADLRAVDNEILPGVPTHRGERQREMIEKAYLRHRAIHSLERFALPSVPAEYPLRSGSMVPPLVTFAQAASLCGFVTVVPDEDGVVRRIPLLARAARPVYKQFALALAAHELARTHGGGHTVTADARSVTIRCGDGTERRIPVDRDGFMLIHWLRGSRAAPSRPSGRVHVPAAGVVFVWQAKLRQAELDNLAKALRVAFLSMGYPAEEDTEKRYGQLGRLTDQLDAAYKARIAEERRVHIEGHLAQGRREALPAPQVRRAQ